MKHLFWLSLPQVLAFHSAQLRAHGGAEGVRDELGLASALDKPQNLFSYDKTVDIFDGAAAYAYGIARNHPFLDGNKRTALMAALVFLELNGVDFEADEVEVVKVFLALAASKLSCKKLAAFFRTHSKLKRKAWPR